MQKWKSINILRVQNGWQVHCMEAIPGKAELPTVYVADTPEKLAETIRTIANEEKGIEP